MLSEGRSRRSELGCGVVAVACVGLALLILWALFAGVTIYLWKTL